MRCISCEERSVMAIQDMVAHLDNVIPSHLTLAFFVAR